MVIKASRMQAGFEDNPQPGTMSPLLDSQREIDGYMYSCAGCGQASFLPIYDPSTGRGWTVQSEDPNDIEHLTLYPSLWHKDGCGWHGWLINGEFRGV